MLFHCSFSVASNVINAAEAEPAAQFPPLSRELCMWPELVEVVSELHTRTSTKSLYTARFHGQQVVLKVDE